MTCLIVCCLFLAWSATIFGVGWFLQVASAIGLGVTVGGAGAKWVFPHVIRSEHDRYPQGRDFEYAWISQSDGVALASLGIAERGWRRPVTAWAPDTHNDGVSMLVAIWFGISFCFLIGEALFAWMTAAAQATIQACC